jgi:hypothetical protein
VDLLKNAPSGDSGVTIDSSGRPTNTNTRPPAYPYKENTVCGLVAKGEQSLRK